MPIRVEQPRAAGPDTESGQARVELLEAQARAALQAGDPQAWVACWSALLAWEEPLRRLQGAQGLYLYLCEMPAARPAEWAPYFVPAASSLLGLLRQDPFRPYLWNALGVLLYELGQTAAARQVFLALQRLEPEHPDVPEHLRLIELRRSITQAQLRQQLGAALAIQARELGQQAKDWASLLRAPAAEDAKLSLVMIVRNEEEMLPEALESVRGVVDEMIVVDTGSSDRTVEIATECGARVEHFPWNGSFSDARNHCLQFVQGDWVLHLDADERLVDGDGPRLRALMHKPWREAYTLVESNYTGSLLQQSQVTHQALRLWRHRPEVRWEGTIHEQKVGIPQWAPDVVEHTALRLIHYGYLSERIGAMGKSERNLQLLLEQARTDPSPFNRFNLGSEYLVLEQPNQARAYLDEAWKMRDRIPAGSPFLPPLVLRAARARRLCGDAEAALEIIREGRKMFPDLTDLLLEQAMCLRWQAQHSEEETCLRSALEQGDGPPALMGMVGAGTFVAQTLLGESLQAQRRPEEAIQVWRQGLERWPEFRAPLGPLASALLDMGEHPRSVLDQLSPLTGSDPRISSLLAQSFSDAGAHVEALELLSGALQRHPDDWVLQLGRLECLMASGNLEGVVACYQQLPQDFVARPLVLSTALLAAALQGQAEQISEWLPEVSDPSEAELFRGWRDCLRGEATPALSPEAARLALGVVDDTLRLHAFEATEQLVEMIGSSQLPRLEQHLGLGRRYHARGFLESAAEAWLAAAQQAQQEGVGHPPEAVMGLAHIEWAQGHSEQALALARDALVLDPDYPPARRLCRLLGDTGAG